MSSAPAAAVFARETILVVEDEPAMRQLFAHTLMRAGYRVHEARNGHDALKVFDRQGGGIDLLLTDIRMPFMGGLELAERLLSRRPSLKLICMSGYIGPDDESLLGEELLTKPFSREVLLGKVREVLDRR